MILLIDADGNGKFETLPEGRDFALNGHVNPPTTTGCPTSVPTPNDGGPAPSTLIWRWDDFTDEGNRWEFTGIALSTFPTLPQVGFPYAMWDAVEAAVSAVFPNHKVHEGRFIEDFNNGPAGTAYYDLITIHDLTLGTRGQAHPEKKDKDDNDDN
jgi:hypothetical protein